MLICTKKLFWRIEVIRPTCLLVHALYGTSRFIVVLQGQCLGQWTLFIAPCMQGGSVALGHVHVCIHVVCIPMVVVIVLALLLNDIGGLRFVSGPRELGLSSTYKTHMVDKCLMHALMRAFNFVIPNKCCGLTLCLPIS